MTHALEAAADPQKPYGDVTYADPGYQADGKKRYPLDSEEHCRAAWSYINMPKNAAKYSAEHLASIKAKIRAALKRYGADVEAAAGSPLLGVELARPGTWQLTSGKRTFTEAMLRDAADFFTATGGTPVPLGFGHRDERFDGDPAVGWVSNVRYDEDEDGPVLLGDLVDMDDWVAAAAPSRWPNRSVEGFVDLDFKGRRYGLALNRVALLGATPPAMPNLKSLRDMQAAVAAAAAESHAVWISASAPLDTETPAPGADEEEPTEEKGAGMDPAKIREALGLDADASDDEVRAALASAGFAPAAVTSGDEGTSDQRIAAAAARDGGVVTIDRAQLQTFEEGMRRADALVKRLDAQERDTTITAAVKEGKFPPARRPHYERMWDADAKGTKELIASLAAGLVPVTASGYAGDVDGLEDDELDREIARLSAPKGV